MPIIMTETATHARNQGARMILLNITTLKDIAISMSYGQTDTIMHLISAGRQLGCKQKMYNL